MYVIHVASSFTQFSISMSSSKEKKTILRTHLALRIWIAEILKNKKGTKSERVTVILKILQKYKDVFSFPTSFPIYT